MIWSHTQILRNLKEFYGILTSFYSKDFKDILRNFTEFYGIVRVFLNGVLRNLKELDEFEGT